LADRCQRTKQNYSSKLKITKALLFPRSPSPVPRSPFSRGQASRGQAFPLSSVIPFFLLSFPRRRESIITPTLDPRLRGDDMDTHGDDKGKLSTGMTWTRMGMTRRNYLMTWTRVGMTLLCQFPIFKLKVLGYRFWFRNLIIRNYLPARNASIALQAGKLEIKN
jgi:hypothetical protein